MELLTRKLAKLAILPMQTAGAARTAQESPDVVMVFWTLENNAMLETPLPIIALTALPFVEMEKSKVLMKDVTTEEAQPTETAILAQMLAD
jgi:hypothetical protein